MRYISKSFFYSLIIAVIIIVADYSFLSTDLTDVYSIRIGWLGVFSIVWCGFSLYKMTGRWFSLIYLFELSFYIFTMGQSLLCALGMEIINYNQYVRESHADANMAYVFTILCLIAMHIGILAFINSKTARDNYIEEEREVPEYEGAMRSIGWIAFWTSLIPYCYEAYSLLRVYLVSGYAAAYASISGSTSLAKIFSIAADYFPFALFMLLVAYRRDRTMRGIVSFLIWLVSIFNFAVGNRSEPICYIMAILWLNTKRADFEDIGRIKNILQIVVVVIVLLMVIPVIGATRNAGTLNIDTIVSALVGNDSVINTVFQTISDLGYSVFPLIKTMQMIPSQYNYHYGVSYFFALIAVIPNIFGGTHISVKYAALAKWLMNTLNMTSGPGYSMPAEAYYNFGWAGFLIMPVIGSLIARLLYESDQEVSGLKLFSMVGCFIVLFTIPRRDTLTAFRNLVYYVGFLYLAVVLIYKRYSARDVGVKSNTEE